MITTAEPILKTRTSLGEGSLWDSKEQVLYWLDITDQKVFRYDPRTGENKTWDVPAYPSTIVPRESGGVVVAVQHGFAALNLETGETQMLAEVESDLPNNRLNDGKCDPAGRLWVGSMDFQFASGAGGLYFLEKDHSVKKVLSGVTCSNGIVWSQDHRFMYYIDSFTSQVDCFDYDLATGDITNRRTAVSIPKELGLPDGMTLDAEGMLWVAIYGRGVVHRYHSETGELLESVEVPGANQVTSCALGGPDLKELYITTATTDYQAEEWEKYPNGGNLFRARVDVKGLPALSFKG